MGAHPPNPLPWGLRPLDPHLPTPAGLGFVRVLGPTRGGVTGVGYSPLFWFRGGTPTTAPCHGGFAPLDPPFSHPRGLWVRQRFGPHSWRGYRGGLLAPSFGFVGGHPPQPPAMGACAPWTPSLPTLVGFGFASVLGPTRGRVADVDNSPLLLVLWGDTPHNPPPGGLRPLDPPFSHPRGLWVRQRFAPPRRRAPPNFPPSLAGKGVRGLGRKGTPPTAPATGASPPWTPVFPPSWALGSPAFWAPPVAGLLMWTTRPFFWFCGGTPPHNPRQGAPPPWTPHCPTLVG